jgi:hypothetical protein
VDDELMRQPRERSRLIYVYDFHLKSGLHRFAHDEVDLEGATPVSISDPCAEHGPDYTTGSEDDVAATPTDAPDCSTVIDPTDDTVDYHAGTGSITVESGCLWDAVSTVSWLKVTSATSRGNGTVEYSYTENTNGVRGRVGKILIGDQVFTLTQGLQCRFAMAPTFVRLDYNAQQSAFFLGTGPTCDWTATINGDWISIIDDPTYGSGMSGTGGALIKFSVTSNRVPLIPSPSRIGTITIEDKIFVVYQSGTAVLPTDPGHCSIDADPSEQAVTGAGGEFTSDITTSEDTCVWVTVPSEDWIHLTDGAVGMGIGTITYSVDANSGDERVGYIRVATLDGAYVDIAITQAAAATAVQFMVPGILTDFLTNPGFQFFNPVSELNEDTSDKLNIRAPVAFRIKQIQVTVKAFYFDSTEFEVELYVNDVATGVTVLATTVDTLFTVSPDYDIALGDDFCFKDITGSYGSDPELAARVSLLCEGAYPFHLSSLPYSTGYVSLMGDPINATGAATTDDARGLVAADLTIHRMSANFCLTDDTHTASLRLNGSDVGTALSVVGNGIDAEDQAVDVTTTDEIGLHQTVSVVGSDVSEQNAFAWAYETTSPTGAVVHCMIHYFSGGTKWYDFSGIWGEDSDEDVVRIAYGQAGTFTVLSAARGNRGAPTGTNTLRLKSGSTTLLEVTMTSGVVTDTGTVHIDATDEVHWELVSSGANFSQLYAVTVLFVPD